MKRGHGKGLVALTEDQKRKRNLRGQKGQKGEEEAAHDNQQKPGHDSTSATSALSEGSPDTQPSTIGAQKIEFASVPPGLENSQEEGRVKRLEIFRRAFCWMRNCGRFRGWRKADDMRGWGWSMRWQGTRRCRISATCSKTEGRLTYPKTSPDPQKSLH